MPLPLLLPDGRELKVYDANNGHVGSLQGVSGSLRIIDANKNELLSVNNSSGQIEVKRLDFVGASGWGTSNIATISGDYTQLNVQAAAINLGGATTVGGKLTVNGDLDVQGSINYVSTQELQVSDTWIHLNADLPDTTDPTSDAGLIVERGTQTDVKLYWDETNDKWVVTEEDGTVYDIVHSGNISNYVPDGTFAGLTDTPNSYTGYGGYLVSVKSDETGLEFSDPTTIDKYVRADSSDTVSGYLSDKVDNSTIEVDTTNHYLKVVDGGINTTQLADNAVTTAKIGDSQVTGLKLDGANIFKDGLYYNPATGEVFVQADTYTNSASIANAINVSASGVAIKVDGTTIGQDASNQLTLKGFGSLTTDNLNEGTTNLYFTDERAQDAVGGILDNSGNHSIYLYYDDNNNLIYGEAHVDSTTIGINANHELELIGFGSLTTDDLAEGLTNLYFTNDRVYNAINNIVLDGTVVYEFETLSTALSAETAHSVPGGYYVQDLNRQTPNMIVLVNGTPYIPDYYDSVNAVWINNDFRASDGANITFHFDLPAGAQITYIKFNPYQSGGI